MSIFNVGDRVVVSCEDNDVVLYNEDISIGMVGVIVDVHQDGDIGVQFYKNISGHDCWGNGKFGYCWYVKPECLSNLSKSLPELDIYGLI